MGKTFTFNGEEYEEIPKEASAAARILSEIYIKLGSPQDPYSKAGEKMMDLIISVWEDLYPRDAHEWYQSRANYQRAELSTKEQVRKRTGRSLASIPSPIYELMKVLFKDYKLSHRDDYIKLVKKYPMFRMANVV